GAVVAHHDVPLVRPRPTLEDVARRKTGVEKALGDGVGGDGRAADRIGRVDLDQLFVDVVGQLAPTGEHDRRRAGLRLLRLRERREADSRRDGRDDEGGAEGGETHRALREWDGRRCVYVVTRPPWRPVAGLSPATLDARKCQPAPMRLRMSRAPAATPIATPPPNRRAVPVPTSGRSQVTGAAISAAATPTITGTNARCTPSTKRSLFCVNWRACQYPNSVTPTVMAMPSKPPTARMNPNTLSLRSGDGDLEIYTPRVRRWFHGVGGRSFHRITSRPRVRDVHFARRPPRSPRAHAGRMPGRGRAGPRRGDSTRHGRREGRDDAAEHALARRVGHGPRAIARVVVD